VEPKWFLKLGGSIATPKCPIKNSRPYIIHLKYSFWWLWTLQTCLNVRKCADIWQAWFQFSISWGQGLRLPGLGCL